MEFIDLPHALHIGRRLSCRGRSASASVPAGTARRTRKMGSGKCYKGCNSHPTHGSDRAPPNTHAWGVAEIAEIALIDKTSKNQHRTAVGAGRRKSPKSQELSPVSWYEEAVE